jgi:thiol:disulfide interchange protein DsbD
MIFDDLKKLGALKILGWGFFAVCALYVLLKIYGPQTPPVSIGQPYNKEQVQQTFTEHKPIILDFYAGWCPECHQLDKVVFSNPAVQSQLSQVMFFRVDATKIHSPAVEKIIDQYEVVGLPTVIFLDQNGQEIKGTRIEGFCSIKTFEKSLQKWAKATNVSLK